MQNRTRLFASAMAVLMMVGMAVAPLAAHASEEGRRNTMLGLGALTGYLFTRGGNKFPAFAGLAATAYAYKRYDDSIRARHKREQRRARYNRSRQYRTQYYRTHRR